ncbi:M protein repeat protein [Penicillium malachiteum]|uniref:M protein repeat protein n=1 Tax=Penicillium malachiteum TaxID=1324776 RepID=A0AAD6HXI6_9EURO|nr:M protein repeat protein [Penicillium malachiteum]
MAQNSQNASKPKWGVGSFFQQAVAGVESRLDHILLDEEERKQNAAANAKPQESEIKNTPITRSPAGSISRSSSNARRNDRLQERLARAMVKNNSGNPNSQASPSPSSPAASPRPSTDMRRSMDIDTTLASSAELSEGLKSPSQVEGEAASDSVAPRSSHDSGASIQNSIDTGAPESLPRGSSEVEDLSASLEKPIERVESEIIEEPSNDVSVDSPRQSAELPGEATSDSDKASEPQRQDEIHEYIERIDALQSKLKYLAKEAAESAKNAAASASPGSAKKQLLEKDERIALLLEEGQKLSKSEMDHRTAIKKLRQQLADNNKAQLDMKKKTEKMERDLANTESRAKRAEAAEKRANDSLSSHTKTTKEFDAVLNERNALNQTVSEMKAQLSRALARAEAAEAKAHSDALDQEKRKANDLEEELASIKIERDISEEKAKKEIAELKEKIDQEKERARMLEAELKGEQSVLESKMESLRTRAEEASSGATGDTQAKLLRQIETLQTQYSVASENWHSLEGSLLSRLANVERERDDLSKKEGDLRKKIRELNIKTKKLEDDVDIAKEAEQEKELRLEEHLQDMQKMQQKLDKASDDLSATQKDLIEQKKTLDASWSQKMEEERGKWREQVISLQHPRGVSPVQSLRRSSNLDAIPSGLSDHRSSSRRSSTMPSASPDIGTPPRQNSYPASINHGTLSPPPINTTTILETPSITFEPDEFFSPATPATPSMYGGTQAPPSRGINDIISESTVGAGPSVQLVERMSATVRRLESERAGSKDELVRVTTQRDEARQQVVDLMRELEGKKDSDVRVEELDAKLTELDQRYQTTLEMLGEKSEQVEELQADIADLKKIYRELVDSTMK